MTSVKSFGPFNRHVGSTRRFPAVVRAPKIRVGPGGRNRVFFSLAESMLTLLAAVASLAAWVVFAFILKVGAGAINLLLAAGGVLLVRWWALRTPAPEGK